MARKKLGSDPYLSKLSTTVPNVAGAYGYKRYSVNSIDTRASQQHRPADRHPKGTASAAPVWPISRAPLQDSVKVQADLNSREVFHHLPIPAEVFLPELGSAMDVIGHSL